MILYPTETLYGLGVGVFDEEALQKLFELKQRDESQSILWMVRDIEDIKKYAEFDEVAERIATKFLPGPLTLVLPLKKSILDKYPFCNKTTGFRISSDPVTRFVVSEFMEKYDMPLTSTSANISGEPTQATVPEILNQFGEKQKEIDTIVNDGERIGLPSTIIEIKDNKLIVHREGQISIEDIQDAI